MTYDDYQRRKEESPSAEFQSLDIYQIFRLSYDWGTSDEGEVLQSMTAEDDRAEGGHVSGLCREVSGLSLDKTSVCLKTLNGYTHMIRISEGDSVQQLKEAVKEKLGMPCEEQRISFCGRVLDDDHKRISEYGVRPGCTLHMIALSRASKQFPIAFINPEQLDPPFNFDFTDVDDGDTKFYRGRKRYYRPCGWKRYAIKVKGQFQDEKDGVDDKWLGKPGFRQDSTKGEWPVSYHGTAKENSNSITTSGYLMNKCIRERFGPGIYSSPSINVAADYATLFPYEGVDYQLVFQNRVCPCCVKVISAQKTGAGGEYWITGEESHIRPYGICIREA